MKHKTPYCLLVLVFITSILVTACAGGEWPTAPPSPGGEAPAAAPAAEVPAVAAAGEILWPGTTWENQAVFREWTIVRVAKDPLGLADEAQIKSGVRDARNIWVSKSPDGKIAFIKTSTNPQILTNELAAFKHQNLWLGLDDAAYYIDDFGRLVLPDLGSESFFSLVQKRGPKAIPQLLDDMANVAIRMGDEFTIGDIANFSNFVFDEVTGQWAIIDFEFADKAFMSSGDYIDYVRRTITKSYDDWWIEFTKQNPGLTKPKPSWTLLDDMLPGGAVAEAGAIIFEGPNSLLFRTSQTAKGAKTVWQVAHPKTGAWVDLKIPAAAELNAETLAAALERAGIPKPTQSFTQKLLPKLTKWAGITVKVVAIVGGVYIVTDFVSEYLNWTGEVGIGAAPGVAIWPSMDNTVNEALISYTNSFPFTMFRGPGIQLVWEQLLERAETGRVPCFTRYFKDPTVKWFLGLTDVAMEHFEPGVTVCAASWPVRNEPGDVVYTYNHPDGYPQQVVWQFNNELLNWESNGGMISVPTPLDPNLVTGVNCQMELTFEGSNLHQHVETWTPYCWAQ